MPQNAINSLLKGLKNHKCFNYLPVDNRTLLSTPTQISYKIQSIKPGSYHFGLATAILIHAPSNIKEIKLATGIDGLPIYKSSGGKFWPIMAYIIVPLSEPKKFFPIRLYYGCEKPMDSNDYIKEFVTEAYDLMTNGITINQSILKVSISVFCCDAPAKSFVLKIKGHTGYSSCTRFYTTGDHEEQSVFSLLVNKIC